MPNKIAIVCNSTNPDLLQYFLRKIEATNILDSREQFAYFTNIRNKKYIRGDVDVYVSSIAKKSFFDPYVAIDLLLSIVQLIRILLSGTKIIHFDTAHISNLFLSIPAKLAGLKLVYTIHDPVPHPGNKSYFIRLYNNFVMGYLADKIIFFSEVKDLNLPVTCSYMVERLSGFKQQICEPKSGEKVILFFGRIEPYKGLDNLYEIIKLSNDKGLNYKYIIAGKGNIRNHEKFNSLNNLEIYNQFITDEFMNELFLKASFAILPYDSATQSGVAILSYSYATPVIAYDVGSLSEYVSNRTGLLVEHGDNESIIEFLEHVDEEGILSLSKNVVDEFSVQYSDKASKSQFQKLYRNLLETSE